MLRTVRRMGGILLLTTLSLGGGLEGGATPSAYAAGSGGMSLELRLEGATGQMRRASPIPARMAVFVYEARQGTQQNSVFKAELADYMRAHPSAPVDVVAIADVRGLNFFPLNEFIRKAVQDASERASMEVLLDWTGSWGQSFHCPSGPSTVLVIGPDGREVFRHVGSLSAQQRSVIFHLIGQTTTS